MPLIRLPFQPQWTWFQRWPLRALRQSRRVALCNGLIHGAQKATRGEWNHDLMVSCGLSSPRTHDSTYKMSPAGRSGRVDTRKPTSLEASGPEHGRKPWSKRQYYPTDGDVHLAS